jgi:hypothetical protein
VDWIFPLVVVIIVISAARKIKRAIAEEAERANRYAEQMKQRRAGHEGAYVAGPVPERPPAGTLQDLLRTLAEQAQAQPEKEAVPPPAEAAAETAVEEEREGPKLDLLQEYREAARVSSPIVRAPEPVEAAAPEPVQVHLHKKKAKRMAEVPAEAADVQGEEPLSTADALAMIAAASPGVVPAAAIGVAAAQPSAQARAFFERLDTMPVWRRAMVMHEVFGPPVSARPADAERWF